MPERPHVGYAARNTQPILEVLRQELRPCRDVLEIGSGTGQHAVAFASELSWLRWQTSDLEDNHAGIQSWIAATGTANVEAPLTLDVRIAALDPTSFDAVFSANTAHIMGVDAVRAMFSLVGHVLRADGIFCLYGPFRIGGEFTTASNEAFDRSLRGRDPAMGIRDLEALDDFGVACDLTRQRLYAMPSNNFLGIWTRRVPA